MTRLVPNRRRSRTSCSVLALATVLAVGATPAQADSLLGTHSFATNSGGAANVSHGLTTTTVTLNPGNTVINWAPSDPTAGVGNVVFQNAGTVATFTAGGDFAVLNNINGFNTRAIEMNGTVNARVGGAQQGSVYFYAPGGFVFGGTSSFSVGSLVVSTLPISNTDFAAVNDQGFGSVVFGQAPRAASAIIMNGTVDASVVPAGAGGDTYDSYVALVAPRVVHNGSIDVNGSALLVAAEATTINFTADGLFDIQVSVGSTDTDGINVHGEITGPAPFDNTDRQGIYLVAVPKNDAMTMVIGNGADLGFTLANSALDDNGVIVLSAGHDVIDGEIAGKSAGHGALATGNFWFTGAHATNNLVGEATGSAFLYSIAPQLTTIFDNDVTVHAGTLVSMQSSGIGASLTVAGNVSLSADKTGAAGQSAAAGSVSLFAQNGATLSIAGTTDLSADGVGGDAASGTAGSGVGGNISISANDGSTLTLSNLTTSATGTGGNGTAAGANAGNGVGGSLSIFANSGVLNMNSALLVDAKGFGGGASGAGLAGGGIGGSAIISASNGGTVTFSGDLTLDAQGIGGGHATGSGGDGYGGTATISVASSGQVNANGLARLRSNGIAAPGAYGEGGDTTISASSDGDISIAILNASADGWGGVDSGSGAGDGQGGTALIQASGAGSTINIAATLSSGGMQQRELLSADGGGGDTSINGATAGTGTGGTTEIKALSGGSIGLPMTTTNDSLVRARGYGGIPLAEGTTGGLGIGGYIDLRVDGGTLVAGNVQLSSIGVGGEQLDEVLYNSSGGDGIGGERHVNVLNGGNLTLALPGGHSSGIGGQGTGTGSGGDGNGGLTTLTVDNATANFTGDTFFVVQPTGGDALGGGNAGDGGELDGGTMVANIQNGGVVNISSGATVAFIADAYGGAAYGLGASGDGFAGTATLNIQNGSLLGGNVLLSAIGSSLGGGTIGGSGEGGTATLNLNNATINGESLTVDASGNGASTNGSTGGNGFGGTARLNSSAGVNSITVSNGVNVLATGEGGSLYGGSGFAGDGTGGNAKLYVFGGSNLTVTGSLTVDASGIGGSGIEGGAGGMGQGGIAEVGAYGGGLMSLTGSLSILGTGVGGYGIGEAGGDGTGKRASLFADGGSLVINGSVDMNASGEGGNGTTGGDGIGGGEIFVNDDGAHIYARNGSIAITGNTLVNSSGYGGNGADGGSGGDGTGGFATIHAANSNSGPSSVTITGLAEDSASVLAEGHGGAGGHGTNGGDAGNGGSGGDGFGGWAGITAAAGNGHIDIGIANLSAQAWGGQGGDGGNSDGGVGGDGGLGGNAFGGGINVGTESGFAEAVGSNLGLGEYGSIYADSSAHGGDGGDGSGGSTNGDGGDGGNATSGFATLLVRGSTVDAGIVDLVGNATGGDAGFGYVPNEGTPGTTGVGGDATLLTGGSIHVLATNRFAIPAQRGTLIAGSINGTAIATGGIGIPNGDVAVLGGSSVEFLNSDAEIGSLNFNIGIGENANEETVSGYDSVSVINGTVDTSAGFTFSTPGDFSLFVDQGWLSAGTLALAAGNFIYDPAAPAIVSLGTTLAGDAFITTDGDFVADTNWDVANNFIVDAPGLIELDNVVSGAGIDFSAGDLISITSLDAGTYVDLLAGTDIDTGNITAGTDVYFEAQTGFIEVGNISAGGDVSLNAGTTITAGVIGGAEIDLDAGGNILFTSADATDDFDFDAGGSVTGGNVTAANEINGNAGGSVTLGNLTAGPASEDNVSVGISAVGNITVGNVSGPDTVGFATQGNLLTGTITAGDLFLAMVGGNVMTNTITTSGEAGGQVYIADDSMFLTGGGTWDGESDFDPSVVLALDPVRTGGSIAINGPVNTGRFRAAAGSTFNAPDITSGSDLDIDAGGNITVGHLVAGLTSEESGHIAMRIISDGSVSLIDINALGGVDITSDGSVTGGDITTGDVLLTDATGAIQYGNISAGLVNPQPQSEPFSVGLISGASIDVGNVAAAFGAAFISVGTIDTGNINAGTDVLGLANGDINLGNITAGSRILLADYSMFTDAGGTVHDSEDVDVESIFAATPVPTNGSITVGNVSAGSFTASAGTNLTVGILDIDGGLSIEAGDAITTGDLDVGDFVLANGGSITTGDIDSESVDMTSTAGDITTGEIVAFGDVALDAFGDILTDDITAGSIDLLAGDDITTGNLTTQQLELLALTDGPIQTLLYPGASITLQSGGDILTDNISSIDGVYADAGGSLTTGTIGAATFIELHSVGNMLTSSISAGTNLFAHATSGNMTVGSIEAGGDVTLATPGTMTGTTVDAGGLFLALTHGDMLFGDANAGEVFLADYAMLASGGIIVSCVGTCGTLGADGVVTAPPTGSSYFYVTTEGGVDGAGRIDGVEPPDLSSNGSLYTTSAFSADAGDTVEFWFNYVTSDGSGYADYAWAALLTTTFDPVAILYTARTKPSGSIVPGQGLPGVEATLNPSSVPIIPGGPQWSPLGSSSGSCYGAGCGYTGWVNSTYEIAQAGNYVLRFGVSNWSDTSLQSGMAFSGITVGGDVVGAGPTPTGGSITIGNVVTGKMTAAAGTTLTTETINSTGSADLYSGGNMLTGAITAGTDLFADAGGTMTLGVISGDDIELFSVGNMSFVSANAGTEIDFETDGNLNGGAITAGNQISGDADGTITLASLTVTDPVLEDEQFSIGIEANGNIGVGNASAPGPIGFATQGNLTTGNISAGNLFMTLVGGDTMINGSITTSGEDGGQVYMADDSMFATGGGDFNESDDDFDKDIVLALSPAATGGSISIAGTVSTGWFRGAAGTTFTTHAVNALDATIFAGGTAVIDGAWDVGDAEIVSNDIDITANGSIEAGDINLISKNATRTVVGDGVNQAGYNLSNAEFGRLSANDINVIADTASGAAPTMLLGDLNYTPSESEGGIEIAFLTGDNQTETAAGSIRIVGDVVFNGMTTDEHEVDFGTGRFELDAATGSLSLLSSGSTIGGSLDLYASRVHVAAGSILDQLAANPTYSGYQQDLNEPASVQRPEGVLRADTIYIEAEGLLGVLIQNTGGQGGPPAGFLARDITIPVEDAGSLPGSINLVVNGQVVTEGGTLTGVAARDALITPEDTGLAAFTSNSTINGCPLTGECIIRPPEPPPSANVVDTQIDLITTDPLGDSEFGNEPEIDDNEEGDEAADNPINPPQPLFDTRPLIPAGDVNDPVSGTGNPALVGSEQECEPGEDGQCPANPVEGDAQ